MLFFNWLTKQMDAVSALDEIEFAPEDTNRETKSIRIMDREEKRLYIVLAKLCKELNNLKKEHEKLHKNENHDECGCSSFYGKSNDLDIKIDIVRAILTESIKMSFEKNENGPSHIQICARNGSYWLAETGECNLEKALKELSNLIKAAAEQN